LKAIATAIEDRPKAAGDAPAPSVVIGDIGGPYIYTPWDLKGRGERESEREREKEVGVYIRGPPISPITLI
jgi:hypothetical protein